jgi:hypothetical protein
MGRKGRCASALSNLLRRSTALATRWGGRRRYGPCDGLPRPLSGGCREKTLNNHINVDALIQKGACRESRALSMDSFENTIALKNNSSNGGAYEITIGDENSVSLSQCLINRHEKFTISRKMLPSLAYKSSLYMFPPLFEAPQTTRAAGCFFESVFVEGPIQKSRLRFKLLRPLNAR